MHYDNQRRNSAHPSIHPSIRAASGARFHEMIVVFFSLSLDSTKNESKGKKEKEQDSRGYNRPNGKTREASMTTKQVCSLPILITTLTMPPLHRPRHRGYYETAMHLVVLAAYRRPLALLPSFSVSGEIRVHLEVGGGHWQVLTHPQLSRKHCPTRRVRMLSVPPLAEDLQPPSYSSGWACVETTVEVAVLSLPPPAAAAAAAVVVVVVAAVGRAVAVADIVAADAVVGVAVVVVVVAVGEFGSEETPVSVVAVESPQLG